MQTHNLRQASLALLFLACLTPALEAQAQPAVNAASKAAAQGPIAPTLRTPPWIELVGGPGAEVPRGAAELRNGDLQVFGQVVPVAGGLGNAWAAKLSPAGVVRWHLELGGSARDEFAAAVPTPDGGSLLAGFTDSFGAGGEDGWLVKLDAKGNVQWQQTYGGVGDEQFEALIPSPDGYYVGGAIETAAGGDDVWLLEVDSLGAVLWQQSIGGNQSDRLRSMTVTPSGLAFVAISNSDFAKPLVPFGRPWLVQLDSQGDVLWQQTYSFSGGDGWSQLIALEDGGFLAVGEILFAAFFRGDAWVVRLDDQGNVLWDRRFGDNFGNLAWDTAVQAQQTPNGNFLVAAITATVSPAFEDLWLVELSPDGEFLRDRVLGGPSAELASSMISLRSGGYLISGSSSDQTDALMLRLSKSGATGSGCSFPSKPSAPNIWTGPLSTDVPTVTPSPTAVVPVVSLAPATRPTDQSVYLCERN